MIPDLTEQEQRIIEQMRLLKVSDPAFAHLPSVIMDRFDILLKKGKKYNGSHSGVLKQNFKLGDTTAFTLMDRKMERGVTLCLKYAGDIPDDDANELVYDSTNQGDIWACCRMERKLSNRK